MKAADRLECSRDRFTDGHVGSEVRECIKGGGGGGYGCTAMTICTTQLCGTCKILPRSHTHTKLCGGGSLSLVHPRNRCFLVWAGRAASKAIPLYVDDWIGVRYFGH